jgi:polyisoprenoid-binding protein YceI
MTTLALIVALSTGSSWTIDPAHAQAKFSVRHMMVMDVAGTLGKVTGNVDMNDKDPTKSTVDVAIEVEPNTQEPKRDAHLKSPEFFDVEKFPKVTFKSKKIAKAGKDKYKVTGDLTIRDVTKETTLDVTMSPEMENPFSKAPTRAVVATGKINRLDYGLKWNMPMANNGVLVGNDVKIEVSAELHPPEQAKPAEEVKGEMKPADGGPAPKK